MNDRILEDLVRHAFPESPDLWGRIRREIAQSIAEELMASLAMITNPCGQEMRDRQKEYVSLLETEMRKGA